MSQAEELLNSLDASNTSGESHIVIGKDRFITVPDSLKRLAVQYDHDIETVTFDCPRYWDEHDMSTMTIYVNYLCADNEPGCYKVKNVAVDSIDSTIMHFDWVISKNVTMAHGPIAFLVCIKNTDADGVEKNHWNSEICKDCFISAGIEYDGVDINEIYPDIIEQWRQEVLAITDDIVAARENGEFKGDRGEPGVSPTIQITDIQAGHRVTITDVEGTKTFDVMDTIVDGTDAVNELLNRFAYIGTDAPTQIDHTLWFDTNITDINEEDYDNVLGCYLGYVKNGYYYAFYPRTRKDLVFGMDEIDNFITANKGIVAHSDKGITYTATVPGITELTAGASFLMIPDKNAVTGNPLLNVNNLGDILLKHKTNVSTRVYADQDQNIEDIHWLKSGEPISVTYNGEVWVADFTLIYESGLPNAISINKGGTGATSIEQATQNLKFNSLAYAVLEEDEIVLDDALTVGKYHLVGPIIGLSSIPFYNQSHWYILTVEDARGEGNLYSGKPYCTFKQTIENSCGERFFRYVDFYNGIRTNSGWIQEYNGSGRIILNNDKPSKTYGTELPSGGTQGQLFFKKNDGCYIYEGAQNGWVKYF